MYPNRRRKSEELRTGDGHGLPSHLNRQIIHELDHLELLLGHIQTIESEHNAHLTETLVRLGRTYAIDAQEHWLRVCGDALGREPVEAFRQSATFQTELFAAKMVAITSTTRAQSIYVFGKHPREVNRGHDHAI